MKKALSILLTVTLIFGIFAFSGCSAKTEYGDDDYKAVVSEYGKTKSAETLAKIIVMSFDKKYYGDLKKYGERFFFCKDESKAEMMTAFKKEVSSQVGKVGEVTDEISNKTYDCVLWMYILLNFYSEDYKTVVPQNMGTCLELLKKATPHFLAETDDDKYYFMNNALNYMENSDEIRKEAYYLMNMYSYETDKDEQQTIYFYLSEVFANANDIELYMFFNKVTQMDSYNTEPTEKGKEDSGRISSLIFDKVEENLEKLVASNTAGYGDICSLFLASPKNLNGDGSVFIFYTEDYIISIYGSPIYGAAVTEKATGEIVLTY